VLIRSWSTAVRAASLGLHQYSESRDGPAGYST